MAARIGWLLLAGSLVGSASAQNGGGSTNPLSLCSHENTAPDSSNYQFSIYNSYGSCTQHCAGYAYAILQGKYCWCSNMAPGSDTSVSSCSETCPGFNTDHCGNANEGLYGYAQIGQPSGTMSASSSKASSTSSSTSTSSSSSSTSSSTPVTSTSSSTTTSSSSTSSEPSSTSTSSSTSSSSSSSASSTETSSSAAPTSTSSTSSTPSSTSSSTSASPTSSSSSIPSSTSASSSRTTSSESSSQLTTSSSSSDSSTSSPTSFSSSASATSSSSASSSAETSSSASPSPTSASSSQTATASAASNTQRSPDASATLSGKQSNKSKGYWHDGGAVAGTFVGVGIGILLILALIIFLCCWRRRRNRQNSPEAKYSDTVGLGISKGSPSTPPNRTGSGSHVFSPFAHSNAPTSPGHMRSSSSAFSNDMNLVPIFDQRVDPNQFYMRWEQNGSRTSLQDNEDYSRKVLRVANPDNASF